jgi:hypothetical protein
MFMSITEVEVAVNTKILTKVIPKVFICISVVEIVIIYVNVRINHQEGIWVN